MSENKKEKCQSIGGITLCRECDAMYWGTPEGLVRDMQEALLPCGHKIHSIILSGNVIKDALKAEEMLTWLWSNGMLRSEAGSAARMAGGSFLEGAIAVPPRDLTEDEYEDLMTS